MREYSIEVPGSILKCGIVEASPTSKPTITATRMKGEDITELRSVVVGQKPGKVLLELTPRAAETLLVIAQFVGGDPDTSRRGDIDAIARALHTVGTKLPATYPCGVRSGFSFSSGM